MTKSLFKHWPLYASVLVFLAIVSIVLYASISANRGYLVYAGDDAYIGMAVARNFAQFGVWGVTRYGFTSLSSTLLWTLLLSLTYYLGGVNQIAPLLWNLVFAVLILVVSYAILCRYKVSPGVKFAALLGLTLLLPLPLLVVMGMEHTLQTLLALVTVFLGARLLSQESPGGARRDTVLLLILAPLVTSTRFEGMFLIAALSGLSLLLKRWRFALGFALCGSLPIIVHGIISVSHGWFWFPTSLLQKASLPHSASVVDFFLSLVNPVFINFRSALHTLVLVVAVLLAYIVASGKGSSPAESRQLFGAVVVLLWLAHFEFVGSSPMYRYDAYLCALSIVYLAMQVPVIAGRLSRVFQLSTWSNSRNLACGLLALILFLPLAVKGSRLLWFLPQCTMNTFEQQYQMGLFVRQYYQVAVVAVNDIGAVNFLADFHCLDLYGLAEPEITAAMRNHTYQARDIQRLASQKGARIAIIYESWFMGVLPPEWVRVGTWTIQNNIINGSDTVSFYAVEHEEAARLRESLLEFAPNLPADVIPHVAFPIEAQVPARP